MYIVIQVYNEEPEDRTKKTPDQIFRFKEASMDYSFSYSQDGQSGGGLGMNAPVPKSSPGRQKFNFEIDARIYHHFDEARDIQ